MYIYVCVCVCVCVYLFANLSKQTGCDTNSFVLPSVTGLNSVFFLLDWFPN